MNQSAINKKLAKLLNKGDSDVEKLLKGYEKQILAEYKISLEEIKKSIAKMFERYGDKVKYSEMVAYNRLTNLEKRIGDEIKRLTSANIKTTNTALKTTFSESFYRTGHALETSLGSRLGFGLLNTDVVSAALLNSLDRIEWADRMKEHAKIYVNQIRSELAQGIIQGKGYSKIAKSVTERTGVNAGKIMRIIRTEGHRVQNAARILGYETAESAAGRLGINTIRLWIATLDSRTRSDHRQLDRVKAEMIDGKLQWTFPSGGTTEAPGMSGIAAEDIHCRCVTIAEFEGIPHNFENRKSDLQGQSYEDWKKGLKKKS